MISTHIWWNDLHGETRHWQSLKSALWCTCAGWTWWAVISMICWWYDPCALYLGTCGLSRRQHSIACSMMTSSYTVSWVAQKKLVICDCGCILHTIIRVYSLCFYSLSYMWLNCWGSVFSIITQIVKSM